MELEKVLAMGGERSGAETYDRPLVQGDPEKQSGEVYRGQQHCLS